MAAQRNVAWAERAVNEARILTDDELRQIGALQVTPGSWRVVYGTDVTHLQAPDDANDWRIAACETPESPGGCARNAALIAAAPDLRRTALHLLQRAERAEAHVTELEAPGECASIHKLRAQVADLQAAIERARPVVDELAAAWDCGSPMMIRHLMERLGRAAHTTRAQDVVWLRSLLSTAHEPVPGLAPQPPPTLARLAGAS